ncbi:hypothetical protein E3P81_00657 [Wallemia ichthyophaga]|nr:hypothetical protein E3P98_00733 [Wallemia ichthyophaga]TIA93867.1 hypothetical protein E3P97_00658 [Wallemia ichthyophaga]TIB35289.1 hypothetical protein E3P85_00514 [Wallemia ichthyophaga]TIB49935.1 hypothetical protein E3P82_00655 [Wallemia ichthyophaga]TIB53684.1 hypothetical protein E3P81_00657 [Wallemia ichthyophaga]
MGFGDDDEYLTSPRNSRISDYKRITRLFKDIFKSDRKPSKSKAIDLFNASLKNRHPNFDILWQNYESLRSTSTSDTSGVEPQQLLHTLKLLSKSSHKKDFIAFERLYNDIGNFWGFDITSNHIHLLILGNVSQRRLHDAISLTEKHLSQLNKPHLFPLLLASSSTNNDYSSYQRILQLIHSTNTTQDLAFYNARLKLAFQFHDLPFVEQLRHEINSLNLQPDLITYTILLDGYSKWRLWEQSNSIESSLRALSPDLPSYTCILVARGRQYGIDEAKKVLKDIAEANLHPNDITLSHLVTLSPVPLSSQAARELIDDLSAEAGVDPSKHTYQAMVEKLLVGSHDAAYEFYMDSPQRTLAATLPLMRTLAQHHDLARMVAIYDQLDARTRLDSALLALMLRVSAKQGDVSTATALLVEMKEAHVTLDTQFQTSFVIALLHSSQDFFQAFRFYANVVDSRASFIDGRGFESIIAEFCGLRFPEENDADAVQIVPALLFSEILNDMRKAGHPPSCKTYTVLLDYYARVRDARSVGKIETLLNVDRSIRPDIYLCNALLNAHNRVGSGARCVELFNALLFSQRADNASLSIALDSAGSRSTPADPLAVYSNAAKFIPPNRKNWETLIEALARRKRFDEAWKVLQGGEFSVDANSIEVLFRLTRASRDVEALDALRLSLVHHYPLLWDSIRQRVDIPWKD